MPKVLIFGAGSAMRSLLSILPEDTEVLGLLDDDQGRQGSNVAGYRVHPPDFVHKKEFDFVVVATRDHVRIVDRLVSMGIERGRILVYPGLEESLRGEINQYIDALNDRLGLGIHRVSMCTMTHWPIPMADTGLCSDDFCRKMSMYLTAGRILETKIPGAIAELGVHRGESAEFLNRLFPERFLYLFDTFEGFSEDDLGAERAFDLSSAEPGDYGDTSIDFVLRRLRYPAKAVVRKGRFPQTATDLDEQFALVSLDVDLYEPIKSGLEYFYPRLSRGGSIFVHDYSSRQFRGVRRAVDEFVLTTGAPVALIPDFCGTAVLPK